MPEPVTLLSAGAGIFGLAIHLARRYFELGKEILDISMGFVLLVVLTPVFAVCAAIIKLSSKGPVFYTQTRVGKNGKTFLMYKLRTMYSDAESGTGPVWASQDDPRTVPTCRWMRRTHADELPQLVNVIKGDMSLIGPRPERPEILANLEQAYPSIRKRLAVRPGITGLAQVRDGYDTSVEAFSKKLDADLEYIEGRKWSLEFKIFAGTLTKLNDRTAR
jgi:lipopolysaccharide/colanic/teichoic acid biosynthesis glycosyltransferase